jgi:hypothetical protein
MPLSISNDPVAGGCYPPLYNEYIFPVALLEVSLSLQNFTVTFGH